MLALLKMIEIEKQLRKKIMSQVADKIEKQVLLKRRGCVWQKVWHPVHTIMSRANIATPIPGLPGVKPSTTPNHVASLLRID